MRFTALRFSVRQLCLPVSLVLLLTGVGFWHKQAHQQQPNRNVDISVTAEMTVTEATSSLKSQQAAAAAIRVSAYQPTAASASIGSTLSAVASPSESAKDDPLGELFAYLDWKSLETMDVVATGYTANKESTGKSPGHPLYGITYSGVKVRRDLFSTIAADTTIFPLGTILYIPGYGYGVVADTGSAIKGHKLDLYFITKEQVYSNWGKRSVRVYVLQKGDGIVTETMMQRLNAMEAAEVFRPMIGNI